MATREPTEQRSRTIDSVLPSAPTRYDLLLAVIPSAFVVALLVSHLLSLSTRAAVVFASLVGVLAVVDGLFLNPPGPGAGGRHD